jgi:hypothetical protein
MKQFPGCHSKRDEARLGLNSAFAETEAAAG